MIVVLTQHVGIAAILEAQIIQHCPGADRVTACQGDSRIQALHLIAVPVEGDQVMPG